MRPIIGITTYVEPASWGVWQDLDTSLVPHAYVESVTLAGGRAVLLPPDDLDADAVAVLDGLVLAGGADLDPAGYGAPADPRTETRPDRDRGELLLARAALDADLPVLGVCRGFQLLAVVAGGRLHQHLPDVLGHDKHRPAPGVFGAQQARFAAGSRIATIMGGDAEIHCYHHQGVADPGTMTVTGWTDDGLTEAVEIPEHAFAVGVQWHPEVSRDSRLFGALIEAARNHRGSKRAVSKEMSREETTACDGP